jgi:AcrR family transcriptional regulator
VGLDRESIIDATARCVRAWGYEATTIRAIAGELDCAVGSIYRHFADKRALIAAVAERVLAPAVERAEAGAELAEAARLYAEAAEADEELYRLLFYLSAVRPEEEGRLPHIVQRLVDAWTRATGARDHAERAWAALHGAIMLGWPAQTAAAEASGVLAAEAPRGRPQAEKRPDEVWLL